MSSFTSKTVSDLYEAYSSVYIDETELFLNGILDTVTDSINQLVNEGYDLSDYSWDEIYESFLENVLEPELQEVESFITQLNESTEELTEEQIENLLQERGGLLSGLTNLFKSRQAVNTATQTLTKTPKPSIIQAPPVKLGAPAPAPSSNPLYAPGVSSGRPTRPSVTPPPGADKGSFARFGEFLSNLTTKGRAQAPTKPPATPPTKPPATPPTKPPATPPTKPPASRQPSGTPQRQQGWPSLGLKDKASKVVRALTPGPKGKGLIKYGLGVPAAVTGAVGGLVGGAIDVKRAATGQSSVSQRLAGSTVGGLGDLTKTAASVAAATPGVKDTGTPGEMQQAGQFLKNVGSNIQKDVDVKRAKELRAQPPGTKPPSKPKRGTPPKIEEKVDPIEIYNRQGNLQKVIPGKGYPITKGNKRGYVVYDTSGKPKFTAYPNQPTPSRPPAATPPATPTKPTVPPTQSRPPASRPPAATPVAPKPAPVPFGKTMPAPASAALDKYKINKDWAAANPRLAQAQVKRAEQRASGKSAFDPEFRKSTINPILYKPGALKAEETMTKDSYDLVLEYLLSNGHADTILEAQYVMMQMSTEHIQSIINE
jgi:hypothetical protein